MKCFNNNAIKLVVSFVEEKTKENVEWEITEIPSVNYEADTVRNSYNFNEELYTPYEDGDTYKVVISVNQEKGEIELFNDSKNEEIFDFEIRELIDDELE